MWTIIAGAVVGLLLGSAIDGEFSLLGAIAGALVGGYLFRRRQPSTLTQHALEGRLGEVEKELAGQRAELAALRQLVTPGGQPARPGKGRGDGARQALPPIGAAQQNC